MMIEILLPVLAILVILSLLKCPIYISILGAAIYLQLFVNKMSLTNVFTGLFESMTKNSLLAVPFFILAGSIIAASSLGQRLINVFIELLKKSAAVCRSLVCSQCPLWRDFWFRTGRDGDLRQNYLRTPCQPSRGKDVPGHHHFIRRIKYHHPAKHLHDYLRRGNRNFDHRCFGGFLPGALIVVIVGIYLVIRASLWPRQPPPVRPLSTSRSAGRKSARLFTRAFRFDFTGDRPGQRLYRLVHTNGIRCFGGCLFFFVAVFLPKMLISSNCLPS